MDLNMGLALFFTLSAGWLMYVFVTSAVNEDWEREYRIEREIRRKKFKAEQKRGAGVSIIKTY